MNWLNLETKTLHAPEYIGADPTARATWLNLLLWCAEQENGGRVLDAASWSDRRWQQTCGVTAAEVKAAEPLVTFAGEVCTVAFYPSTQEQIVREKRLTAQTNGKLGGRPPKRKPISEPTLVPTSEPRLKPMSESVKESKGKETIAPNGAEVGERVGIPAKPSTPAKRTRARDPLLDALASVDGSDLAQVTPKAWQSIAAALKEIRTVCPDLTADEIHRRAGNYRQHMPSAMLTPHALAKHWAKCDRPPQSGQPTPQPQRRYPAFTAQ